MDFVADSMKLNGVFVGPLLHFIKTEFKMKISGDSFVLFLFRFAFGSKKSLTFLFFLDLNVL